MRWNPVLAPVDDVLIVNAADKADRLGGVSSWGNSRQCNPLSIGLAIEYGSLIHSFSPTHLSSFGENM